ncbi:uncharacterized protein TNCT_709211 [Trichonephila clavata]|uniref:Uncharacterized protein n=1 Tax=Trichonephila clavata TaxID=2740835 RepID=A0A8X6F5Y7_TRICU|nr:uncharacterized protein TNCT_709211 [Trichonephila clavata]
MPTGFRILCTHEGAAAVKNPSCLEQCAREREIGFSEKAGLRSVIQSEVIPCRHSGCGFSQTTNSLFISTDDLSRSARLLETEMLSTITETRFRKTASFARPPNNFRTVW